MNKMLLSVLSIFLLSACSVGKYSYDKSALDKVDMNFVGIPTILGAGALGSSVPITPEYSLTVAHVAKYMMYKVKAYHPSCDLALVYHKNNETSFPKFRNSVIGENINMYGYSYFSAMPVSSSGKTLSNTEVISKWNKADCVLVATNAGAVQGMSGGAVYNEKDNTLAGIVQGYASSLKDINNPQKDMFKNVSFYIPYSQFKDWINEEIRNK